MQSNLGEALRVQVPVTGATEDLLIASCIKPGIETLEGDLVDVPRVEFVMPPRTGATALINLVSKKIMAEPVVKFSITMTCGPTIQRIYPLLLDFAESPNAVHSVSQADTIPVPDTRVSAIEVTKPAAAINGASQKSGAAANSSFRKNHAPKSQSGANNATVAQKKFNKGPTNVVPARTEKHSEQIQPTGKDVLKVSGEDIEADSGLKMSQTLTTPDTSNPDQQRIAENKIAQTQFAAVMRGEDPFVNAQNAIKKQELKSKNLQSELDKIKQLDALKMQKDKEFSPLLIGLSAAVAALFLALAGVVMLAVVKSRKSKNQSWWDTSAGQKKNVADIVDYLQTAVDDGNLDPNPITAIRQQANTDHGDKVEGFHIPVNKEEPGPKFKRMGLPALEDTNSSTFNFFNNQGQSIHIEEISDVTQEAEFWMSVNDPQRAIEILEQQGLDENQAAPITWLYLLDLYRLVGDEQNYRDLQYRFKLKFNAKIPNFNEKIDLGAVRSFEDFPHLVSNCCALWHTEDIFGYLGSLLADDREGARIGFDLPVYRDILFLLTIANELKRPKYNLTSKENNPVKAREDIAQEKSTEISGMQAENLVARPAEPVFDDYPNSLNFDLLDFKTDDKEKN